VDADDQGRHWLPLAGRRWPLPTSYFSSLSLSLYLSSLSLFISLYLLSLSLRLLSLSLYFSLCFSFSLLSLLSLYLLYLSLFSLSINKTYSLIVVIVGVARAPVRVSRVSAFFEVFCNF